MAHGPLIYLFSQNGKNSVCWNLQRFLIKSLIILLPQLFQDLGLIRFRHEMKFCNREGKIRNP